MAKKKDVPEKPEIPEEYLIRAADGERIAVADMTEDEAKDFVRYVLRTQRLHQEMLAHIFVLVHGGGEDASDPSKLH